MSQAIDYLYGTITKEISLPPECVENAAIFDAISENMYDSDEETEEATTDDSFFEFSAAEIINIKETANNKLMGQRYYTTCCQRKSASISYPLLEEIIEELTATQVGEQEKSQILNKAIDKGVKFYPKHNFENFKDNIVYFKNGNKVKTDILIGADGPLSKVNKITQIQNNKKHIMGKQIKVRYKTEPSTYKVYFNIPDFFSWVVPEDENTARIGCASSSNVNQHFDNLIKKLNIKKEDIIETQGAVIPQYNPSQKYQKENTYLIGDAGSIIKNISGGGLLPAIKSANALANSLNKNKNYKKELLKNVLKSLNLNYFTRNVLNKFNEKDYDKLIKILKEYGLEKLDRDNLNYLDFLKPKLALFSLKALIRNV